MRRIFICLRAERGLRKMGWDLHEKSLYSTRLLALSLALSPTRASISRQ